MKTKWLLNQKFTTLLTPFLLISFILTPVTTSQAGWVDDWVRQKQVTDAGFFEGQKRGYFTGGAFSARWPMGNDHLFTVEPPRLNFGCGGIDAFMGGFGFLNFEYLVQKLQRMMAAAPAVAFDLALKTLCEPCSNTIKTMEAIANELNQLQLDDCKAAKVMTARLLKPFAPEGNNAIRAEADKEFTLTQGIKKLPQTIKDIWRKQDNQQIRPDNEKIAGCPFEIQAVFGNPGMTILEALNRRTGMQRSDSHIALMRGLIGDVQVEEIQNEKGVKTLKFTPIPPCPANNPQSVESFIRGNVEQRVGGVCSPITDVNRNLERYAQDRMSSIVTRLRNEANLSDKDKLFISRVPLPIFSAMRAAIVTGQEQSIVMTLAHVTARAYAFGIMSEIYNQIAMDVARAEMLMAKQGVEKDNCKIEMLTPGLSALRDIRDKAHEFARAIMIEYSKSAGELNAVFELAQHIERFDVMARESMAGAFGQGVAGRALRN